MRYGTLYVNYGIYGRARLSDFSATRRREHVGKLYDSLPRAPSLLALALNILRGFNTIKGSVAVP